MCFCLVHTAAVVVAVRNVAVENIFAHHQQLRAIASTNNHQTRLTDTSNPSLQCLNCPPSQRASRVKKSLARSYKFSTKNIRVLKILKLLQNFTKIGEFSATNDVFLERKFSGKGKSYVFKSFVGLTF